MTLILVYGLVTTTRQDKLFLAFFFAVLLWIAKPWRISRSKVRTLRGNFAVRAELNKDAGMERRRVLVVAARNPNFISELATLNENAVVGPVRE